MSWFKKRVKEVAAVKLPAHKLGIVVEGIIQDWLVVNDALAATLLSAESIILVSDIEGIVPKYTKYDEDTDEIVLEDGSRFPQTKFVTVED
jgi:hypothetical protein